MRFAIITLILSLSLMGCAYKHTWGKCRELPKEEQTKNRKYEEVPLYYVTGKGAGSAEIITPDGYTLKTDSKKELFNIDKLSNER